MQTLSSGPAPTEQQRGRPPVVPPVDGLTADELMTYLQAMTTDENRAYLASLSSEELDKGLRKLQAASARLQDQMQRAPKVARGATFLLWLRRFTARRGRWTHPRS